VPSSTQPSDGNVSLSAVPAIAATVPADIRATGRLVIGVNVPYAPNEFRDSYGKLVGFDVDLMNAVTRTLGLEPDYRETAFETIMPSVQSGNFNLGMSSMTDTAEREQAVDFVTYFEAGTLWAQRPGVRIDPNNACGLRVGVTHGVIQDTHELPTKSEACVAAGQPPIDKVVYTRQDDLTNALISGDIDAMTADSPVTAKGSGLAESLRQAVEHLMQTGEYRTIATMWGVDMGAIDKSVINGAVK
jgi:ABC-type amino acid transport substrate-binding protein